MIKIKKIGKWVIEYPTTINGDITYNHAFGCIGTGYKTRQKFKHYDFSKEGD